MPPIIHSSSKTAFTLNSSGIAGFFGGEEAFAAMQSVHLLPSRRWLGWYNSPGSYFVAKKYGMLPRNTFWDGIFPGPAATPAELLELDGKHGLQFIGVYSGTQLPTTGHLSYLISQHCKEGEPIFPSAPRPDSPETHRNISVTVIEFDDNAAKRWDGYPKIPEDKFESVSDAGTVLVLAAIILSVGFAVLSVLFGDWFSFSMILYGAIANGITCRVFGTGNLRLNVLQPHQDGSQPAHGILFDGENMVLVKGTEAVISTILNSRYKLEYTFDTNHHYIGCCSILLLAQFLLQLLLIPQGTLIGQGLFLSTLGLSWVCNGYFASLDRDQMQTRLLFKLIGEPRMLHKIKFDRWAAAVAFAMRYYHSDYPDNNVASTQDIEQPSDMLNLDELTINNNTVDWEGIIEKLLPNKTPAWKIWKGRVCLAIRKHILPGSTVTSRGISHSNGHRPSQSVSSLTALQSTSSVQSPTNPSASYLPICEQPVPPIQSQDTATFIKMFLDYADDAFKRADSCKATEANASKKLA